MATLKEWAEPVFYVDEGISGTKEAKDRPSWRSSSQMSAQA